MYPSVSEKLKKMFQSTNQIIFDANVNVNFMSLMMVEHPPNKILFIVPPSCGSRASGPDLLGRHWLMLGLFFRGARDLVFMVLS
jgi:hypothetical protein